MTFSKLVPFLLIIFSTHHLFSQLSNPASVSSINQLDENGRPHGWWLLMIDSSLKNCIQEESHFVYIIQYVHGYCLNYFRNVPKGFKLEIQKKPKFLEDGGMLHSFYSYRNEVDDIMKGSGLELADGTFIYTYADHKRKMYRNDTATVVFDQGVPQSFHVSWNKDCYMLYDFSKQHPDYEISYYVEDHLLKRYVKKGYQIFNGKRLKLKTKTIRIPRNK